MTNLPHLIERCESGAAKAMETALWLSMAQSSQTFADLWPTANRAAGHAPMDSEAAGYRMTDRWLQSGRRKGWLAVVRVGRKSVWSLTPDGRGAFLKAYANKEGDSDGR